MEDSVRFWFILNICVSVGLHQCQPTTIQRKTDGDLVRYSPICKKCSCIKDTKTYLGLKGSEKCIGMIANGECDFSIQDFPVDIPLITADDVNKKLFQIEYRNKSLCPSGYQPSNMNAVLQNNVWEEAPKAFTETVSMRISNTNQATIIFHKIWSGLLLKIRIGCEKDGKRYYPRNSCVLFKYNGSALYPWTFESIGIMTTTTSTTTQTTTTQTTTTQTNTRLSSSQNPYGTSTSSASQQDASDSKKSTTIVIVAIAVGGLIGVVIMVVIFIYCRQRRKRKSYGGKTLIVEDRDQESIYDQIGTNGPTIEFNNKGYSNQINIYEDIKDQKNNNAHNYVNTELTGPHSKYDSNYYNIKTDSENPSIPVNADIKYELMDGETQDGDLPVEKTLVQPAGCLDSPYEYLCNAGDGQTENTVTNESSSNDSVTMDRDNSIGGRIEQASPMKNEKGNSVKYFKPIKIKKPVETFI